MAIKTSAIAIFLNTSTTSTASYARIRKQSELNFSYDAETEEENYIDEDGPTTETTRYTISFDGEYVAYEDDDVFSYLDDIRINRLTGEDAQTDALIAYKYKPHSDSTTSIPAYVAEKDNVTIAITGYGGDGGGGKVHINYTITLNGNATMGKVTVSAGGEPTFTAD